MRNAGSAFNTPPTTFPVFGTIPPRTYRPSARLPIFSGLFGGSVFLAPPTTRLSTVPHSDGYSENTAFPHSLRASQAQSEPRMTGRYPPITKARNQEPHTLATRPHRQQPHISTFLTAYRLPSVSPCGRYLSLDVTSRPEITPSWRGSPARPRPP